MFDAFTSTTVLFTGLKVKAGDGNRVEAETQLGIWMAGSLRKKAELARRAGLLDTTTLLVEPAFAVVGHDWDFYLAYLRPEGGAHVVEHGSCATKSISGCFQILKLLQNTIEYGLEGLEEGEEKTGFWGGFLGPVLEKLVDVNVRSGA